MANLAAAEAAERAARSLDEAPGLSSMKE